ncbi:MAG: Tetratricopeptide repeat protein [Cyanobacteriota bacterium erpe_2018_sw_39hr_WHONDRS-SW48-000098_B_bin.30]|nr:Tetratricopeptide repeat protein [Cyanobacteriota bacterium erpe_2018_sw_39hr_WHONDRS-SW48-000098_B_bin.30]
MLLAKDKRLTHLALVSTLFLPLSVHLAGGAQAKPANPAPNAPASKGVDQTGVPIVINDPAQRVAPYSLAIIRSSNSEIKGPQLDSWLTRATQKGEPEPYLVLAKSRVLCFNRDFKGGLRLAQKANTMRPGDAIFLIGLGRAYATLDQEDEALRCYRQALNSKTLSAFSAEMLSNCFIELDALENAYEAGTKGLKLKDPSSSLRYRTADVAKNLGRFKEAEVLINEVFKGGTNSIEIWNLYSEIERGLKNWKEVIVACDKVLAFKQPLGRKKMIEAQAHKADAYQQMGDYKTAVKEWTIIINRLPLNQTYRRNRAQCYNKLGDKAAEAADLAAMKKFDQSLITD